MTQQRILDLHRRHVYPADLDQVVGAPAKDVVTVLVQTVLVPGLGPSALESLLTLDLLIPVAYPQDRSAMGVASPRVSSLAPISPW